MQGHKQWVAEVQFLGVVDHPNLVKLIGYCATDGERGIQQLLVYEFMPNKSLEDHLFRKAHETLPWQRRLQIMLGPAQGLAYLHEELEAQILTGRRSLERSRPKEDQKLIDFIRRYPIDSKKFGIIIDPRLEARYSLTDARKIAKLADSCLLKSAKDRPKMSQVVETLKQILEVSTEGSPSSKSFEVGDDEPRELTEKSKMAEVSESSKRRLAQLAKLSEHVGGAVSKKGFMIMHRAKKHTTEEPPKIQQYADLSTKKCTAEGGLFLCKISLALLDVSCYRYCLGELLKIHNVLVSASLNILTGQDPWVTLPDTYNA
ncbi:hypothetical protein LXL04_010594 [Taraxacum kok-saghyz]